MRKYIFVVLGIVVGALALFSMYDREDLYVVTDPYNYDAVADREFWIDTIKKVGPEKSYTEFVTVNNASSEEVRHVRSHVMGEALFDTEGVGGIGICDSSFGFGCFHGLFTVGFASVGDTFVQEADALCVERYGIFGTGCQHGIGHGIVEYVGHTNLSEALSLCEETSQPTPLLGCTSGVFMEHNTPFTVLPGVEALEPYPFDERKPYGVCEEVADKYKKSCYYELAGWWEVVLKGNELKMGELCSEIADSTFRHICSLGVGAITSHTSYYSVEESSHICFAMPKNIITSCHAGAAWSMLSNPDYSEQSEQVCAKLDTIESEKCKNSSNLAEQYSYDTSN